ncbi:MAG: lipid A biosynthesis acyltransferase, partial [Bacteroidota bacterium]
EDQPAQTPEWAITEKHVRLLEAEIRRAPQFWLWSHRRWKHQSVHNR